MSIRSCAMQDPAFYRLYEVYSNRESEAARWKESGGKVLGELGCDVPDELVIAAGLFPVRVYADADKPLTLTDRYLEFSFDPVVRKQFEKLVDGTYFNQIDFLGISNSTDVIIRIYLYLREILRSEPKIAVPPTTFIDWLFTRNRMHQERNELVVSLFWKQLEKWTGKGITEEDVFRAAEICNENRAALRKMDSLRYGREAHINGSEALVIIGAALFMNRQEHTSLVSELVQRAERWPIVTGPRIYMTGSNQETTELYEMIENAGGTVIGEDHDWGSRFFERDLNLKYGAVRGIVDRYMLRSFSSKKAFVSQRVKTLDEAVNHCGAQGVLFYTNIYEDAASWDYPSQRASLEGRGVPTKCFAKMQYPTAANELLQEQIAEFVSSLGEDK